MAAEENANATRTDVSALAPPARGHRITIRLSGAQTIAQAQVTHARLVQALAMADAHEIEIDCTDVDEADLSFIQLLIAAVEGGRVAGRAVTLSSPAQGIVADALVKAGLSHPAGPDHGWLNPFWNGQRTTP